MVKSMQDCANAARAGLLQIIEKGYFIKFLPFNTDLHLYGVCFTSTGKFSAVVSFSIKRGSDGDDAVFQAMKVVSAAAVDSTNAIAEAMSKLVAIVKERSLVVQELSNN